MHASHRWTLIGVSVMAVAAFLEPTAPLAAQGDDSWIDIVAPDNSFNFGIYKGEDQVANIGMTGWGPNWGWRGIGSTQRAVGDELNISTPFESNKDAGEVIGLGLRVWKSGPQAVSYSYTLNAAKDVPLTELVATVSTSQAFQAGQAIITQADGQQQTLPLSFGLIRAVPETKKIAFQSKNAGEYDLTIDPPAPLHVDNGLRVVLARDQFPTGTKTFTLTFSFPGKVDFLAKDSDLKRLTKVLPGPDWYPFTPTNDVGPSAIGFEDWLDKPAGKHGGVRMVGDQFKFEDGTPTKFWGTNLAYAGSAPNKPDADFMAARFAKWGVNAVRMHKFTGNKGWEGIGDPNDATKMDPEGLDRLDYFSDQLTKHGIYYGWSHTYGFRPRPGNRARLLAYDEIENKLQGNTYALINFAEDVQDLMIETVVNLLKHQNPYTGKTYAQDPALCYVELQNEDDIFFYTSDSALNACPTYKKHLIERWSGWLQQKYGTTDALKKAWGGLKQNETLEAKNIEVQANPWFFGEDHLPGLQDGERQRLLDNAAFFHEIQNQYYQRFVKAIRDAGYQGPLVGSPWQAPAMLPHYYNLKSDAMVGYVDRHNYFGGGIFDTMMSHPGSGYLSTGLQQVADRPFGISEWIHVYPSLYSAEGPAILAAYGMGLQGWSASYEFQSASGGSVFSQVAGTFPWGVWNVDVPTQLGQYPLLNRMIQRGDVKEGPVISVRRVSPEELAEGKFSFSDHVKQQGDVKSFTGTVPEEALAAGRCLVAFTDKPEPAMLPDMEKYKKGEVITSATGQLAWSTANKGHFVINTPGTCAVVGFAEGILCGLGDVKITLGCSYASLIVTAADKNADLITSKTALVSALARISNTGFSYFTLDKRVIENGKAPILVEPVKATITFTKRHIAAVNVLDHDGKRTGRTLPVTNGSFTIDGASDKTPFYEVVFE